jgi:hypothetical protein
MTSQSSQVNDALVENNSGLTPEQSAFADVVGREIAKFWITAQREQSDRQRSATQQVSLEGAEPP